MLPRQPITGNAVMPSHFQSRPRCRLLLSPAILILAGCTTIGSMMSPYSEKFSCKNDDHGQCIHPERAYEEAVAGVNSKSDPRVTNDKALLREPHGGMQSKAGRRQAHEAWGSYRDSVYQELKGLIDAPTTPMLKPAQTVRTLILPYADRQRPDRLYMPRYVYSVVDRPVWVVGGTLIGAPPPPSREPVLGQRKEAGANGVDAPLPASALPQEVRP